MFRLWNAGTGRKTTSLLALLLLVPLLSVNLAMSINIPSSSTLTAGSSSNSRLLPRNPGTTHQPILIVNDTDFAAQASSEGWPGTGTSGDPYIIEGYDIDRAGTPGACIEIRNTQVHFIIRNCLLHGANDTGGGSGILLWNVTNGVIESNICMNNQLGIDLHTQLTTGIKVFNNTCNQNTYGIRLYQSDNNMAVANNTCNDNSHTGIWLEQADANIVENNTCNGNLHYGIRLLSSQSCTVANNICNNNEKGISLSWSSSALIAENTLSDNGYYGLELYESGGNTVSDNTFTHCGLSVWATSTVRACQSSVTGNTVNGAPLIYLQNQTGGVAPAGAGQVVLVNCTGLTVHDQSLINCSVGILLIYTNHTTLSHNLCKDNRRAGVVIDKSHHVNVIEENYTYNVEYGLYVYSSNSTRIINSTISFCTKGVYLHYSNSTTMTNNTFYYNAEEGILIYSSCGNNSILWNVFDANWISGARDDSDLHNNVFDYNYWSHYSGTDADQDGIGDTPHPIPGKAGSTDPHPLMLPPGSPPVWLQTPADQTITVGDVFRYDLNATASPPGIDEWWINDTVHFTIDSLGIITNATPLPPGVYGLQVWVNDTQGNTLTATFKVTVQETTTTTTTIPTTSPPPIPGFPGEAIVLAITLGLGTMLLLRRRRRARPKET